MSLKIENLIPIPLRDKVRLYRSGVWNCKVEFAIGEYVFVQAPSGTGKTTLVHLLYGLRKDYEGAIFWYNRPLAGDKDDQIAALRTSKIGVIFQDMRLFPALTAWENLEAKRLLTGTVSEQQVMEWMQRLGLQDKRNALAATMSYGEQQRLAIIRALLQPFDWLLMDEPFSHLDHANTDKARALITEVVQQNKAGMLLADLDENRYFDYHKTLML